MFCIIKVSWRQWHPTPVLLPGKSHGQRSLVGCSPWCRWGSDTTERLHFHFSLSCIGEGNGNPLQCSCLENPRDGAAWWATIYGVAQSQTWLKRLSSSRVPVDTWSSFIVLHFSNPSCIRWNARSRLHYLLLFSHLKWLRLSSDRVLSYFDDWKG